MTCKRISTAVNILLGVECGDFGNVLPQHLRVSVVSREVGGRAVFSCAPGYGLRGASETACLSSGEWATPYPSCVGNKIHNFYLSLLC